MIQINSPANENFKRWRELSSAKGIRKHGEFFLMGEKLIEEFRLNPGSWRAKAELLTEEMTSLWPRDDRDPATPKRYQLAPALLKELDGLGTGFNLLVLEAPEMPVADLQREPVGVEVVSPLGDPANLGALMRSCVAFGVSRLILTEESAFPFHPKAVKASAGACLRLEILRGPRLRDYQSAGQSFVLDLEGTALQDVKWPTNFRLILGEEGPGFSERPPQIQSVMIPTGPVESLNVTVAASLALWETRRAVSRS